MMPPLIHRGLTAERWQMLSIVEQLGNVGSEVERAIRANAAGRIEQRDAAIARALELFDLTAADDRWRGHRRKEILRVREYFCRLFYDVTVEPGTAEFLSGHFLQYGVAARLEAARRRERRAAPS